MDNNCARELTSAIKKGSDSLIVVVLELALLNPKSWFGSVADFYIGEKVYIDFSTPEKQVENLPKLREEIQR